MPLIPAPIEKGSDVYYVFKPIAGALLEAEINAKVIEIYPATSEALIEIATDATYNSPKITKVVYLNELENKFRIVDVEATRRIEESRFNKAEKINHHFYNEYVYDGESDKFYASLEEYLDDCHWYDATPSAYLFATTSEPINRINSEYFIESIYENFSDEYEPSINGLDELQIAIDKFYEVNSHITVLLPDYGRVVLIDKTLLEN